MHAGHDHLVKMDIADFFDSTGQSKVYGVFSRYTPYNKAVKTFLTKLVCHNGHQAEALQTTALLFRSDEPQSHRTRLGRPLPADPGEYSEERGFHWGLACP